ncbi:Transcription factor grauzone [Pseudolycoriella hygida]|uniref:Transcription factor grauzone n=1 Tax=Pseudolycoriella hygida TaxID=35572 RepID=A0A9Q0RYU8_9DIPT|nr:Transcription factor grauzone [Pseudolycoriella hygida]
MNNKTKILICRLCGKENEKYFDIFGEEGRTWNIASIIQSHFSFQLTQNDKYSQICHTCWCKVQSFHIYYLEIQEAQKYLEFLLVEESPTDNTLKVEESKDTKFSFVFDMTQETLNADISDSDTTLSKAETIREGANPSVTKSRYKRKRDHPNVLADDDLIRNWCQMKCTVCPELFKDFTFKDVKVHYDKEHGMNGFLTCCHKKFFRRVRALEHIARHINPEEFSCKQCNKNFSDKPSLLNHLDGHVSPDQRPHKCDSCEQSFVRRYQLSQHRKHRHFTEEKKFVCEKCSKSFLTKSILQSHIRSVHSNTNVLMCDVCAKTFKSKQCLKQHILKHRGEDTTRVQCTICSAWLKHPNSLRGHMTRHLEAEIEHICKECGKTAPSRQALRSHQRYIHSNIKLFPCTLCTKSFKKSLTLKEHVASCHTGEVLYHCPFCTKTFNSSANLYSHKKRMHQNNDKSVA